MDPSSVKGTRDFYPEDLRLRNWLFAKFRETSRLFGFQEFETPVVETDEWYTRKSGPEIVNQMYVFENRKGGDLDETDKKDGAMIPRLVMRPEMTPSLARLILQRGKNLIMPIKWYNIAQCWRYETCTTGRRREFFQWNLDILGLKSYQAEIELLMALVDFFQKVGLEPRDIVIKISDRRLLTSLLKTIGLDSETVDLPEVLRILDKKNKVDNPNELLVQVGLTAEEATKILDLANKCWSECCDLIINGEGDNQVLNDLSGIFSLAEDAGLMPWLDFDLTVVRGLDYYTGVVFEVFDRRGRYRAICGGGRYDRLLEAYDPNQSVAACGFGFGDCVILEVLKSLNKLPKPDQLEFRVDFLVVPFNDEFEGPALQIVRELRRVGCSVHYMYNKGKRIKWYYSYADREKVKKVIFVAPDEYRAGKVQVKDLDSSTEQAVLISELKYYGQ